MCNFFKSKKKPAESSKPRPKVRLYTGMPIGKMMIQDRNWGFDGIFDTETSELLFEFRKDEAMDSETPYPNTPTLRVWRTKPKGTLVIQRTRWSFGNVSNEYWVDYGVFMCQVKDAADIVARHDIEKAVELFPEVLL